MSVQVIPSILVKSKRAFDRRFSVVNRSVRTAQLDVLDNTFLPFKSFRDSKYIHSKRPRVGFEVHLMINNVGSSLKNWDYPWVKKIIFHLEAEDKPEFAIWKIKTLKKKVGIAINPPTPASALKPYLKQIDTALVMTVHPGRNGAPFVPAAVSKIRQIRQWDKKVKIEVDGGLNPATAKQCVRAGAGLLVVGSYLKNEIFLQRLKELRSVLKK